MSIVVLCDVKPWVAPKRGANKSIRPLEGHSRLANSTMIATGIQVSLTRPRKDPEAWQLNWTRYLDGNRRRIDLEARPHRRGDADLLDIGALGA
jgi:hypothetical protein